MIFQTRIPSPVLHLPVFIFVLLLPALGTVRATGNFFTPPEAPFVMSPSEEVFRVSIPEGSAESAQAIIDSARDGKPGALLMIHVSGKVVVRSNPLRLGTQMCLIIEPDGAVVASKSDQKTSKPATAASLISIDSAESVSVTSSGNTPAILDGGGLPIVAVSVKDSGRINLNHLAISGCGVAAISYAGRDPAVLNDAGSLTRSSIRHCGDGLRVEKSGGFMCMDNEFKDNTGTAVSIDSLNGVVAGNAFIRNKTAIRSSSDRGIIARNAFGGSEQAIDLTASSKGNLLSENRGLVKDLKISIAGSGHQLFQNTLPATVSLAPDAKETFVIANQNLQIDPAAPGVKFFDPPTLNRPHSNPVIVAAMGRIDIQVAGGKKPPSTPETKDAHARTVPVDLSVVEAELTKARTEHPGDVIVLHLEGEFVCKSPAGLELPPNSCLILDGRILADYNIPIEPPWEQAAPSTQVILLPKTGYCSVSGGKIDAGRQAFFPLNANTGSIALIEGVSLLAGTRDGINTTGRKASDPLFIYRCNVYGNNGRGIWSHVASRVHSIANICSGNFMDGIDLDAHAIDCTALFNVCNGNRRHGVFVEEAIQNNIVFGNQLDGNGTGVHVWNEKVKGNTGPNVIAANECSGNRRGIGVGGRADDRTADGNLFFNNVCTGNREEGILSGNSKARKNFFSQCVVSGNNKEDIKYNSGTFFLNTVDPKNP